MRIFPKNRALSLFYIYGPLTSCKKLERLLVNSEKSASLTYGRTNEHEFIGPFSTSWGTNEEDIGPTNVFKAIGGVLGQTLMLI